MSRSPTQIPGIRFSIPEYAPRSHVILSILFVRVDYDAQSIWVGISLLALCMLSTYCDQEDKENRCICHGDIQCSYRMTLLVDDGLNIAAKVLLAQDLPAILYCFSHQAQLLSLPSRHEHFERDCIRFPSDYFKSQVLWSKADSHKMPRKETL